jgi:endonuclease/exonuclease/phosphatase family metal-dependent hydrolase
VSKRVNFYLRQWRWVVFALALCVVTALEAAPVRVTTWNLQPRGAASTNGDKFSPAFLQETSGVLRELAPDVIILQQVPDLQSCEELARALLPAEYNVAVISSFRDAETGQPARTQVAILSKGRAYSQGTEAWKGENPAAVAPGGLAYAAIRLGDRNFGFFSVDLGGIPDSRDSAAQQQAREEAARQLVQQIDALHDPANGIQSVVVGGDFNTSADDPKLARELTLTRLERAGLANAFVGMALEKRITLPGNGARPDATADYIFTRDAGKVANVRVVPVALAGHYPVTTDLDLGGVTAAAVGSATPADSTPSLAAFWQSVVRDIGIGNVRWLGGLLAGSFVLVALGAWMLARRPGPATAVGLPMSPRGAPAGPRAASLPNTGEIVIVARSTQTGSSAAMRPTAEATPVVHMGTPGYPDARSWQRRAEDAERRAEQAATVLRKGLLPQLSRWLKGRAVQKLVTDRAQLIEAQRTAAMKMQAVDERLTKVEQHIQQRTREYEARIEDLQEELTAAKEENRELIRAKIAQVRAEMERERARMLQHAGE